jgi:hypothetical protein
MKPTRFFEPVIRQLSDSILSPQQQVGESGKIGCSGHPGTGADNGDGFGAPLAYALGTTAHGYFRGPALKA